MAKSTSAAGVEFVRGDLLEQEAFDRILAALPEREVGLVLSDMGARVLKGGVDALIKLFEARAFRSSSRTRVAVSPR